MNWHPNGMPWSKVFDRLAQHSNTSHGWSKLFKKWICFIYWKGKEVDIQRDLSQLLFHFWAIIYCLPSITCYDQEEAVSEVVKGLNSGRV